MRLGAVVFLAAIRGAFVRRVPGEVHENVRFLSRRLVEAGQNRIPEKCTKTCAFVGRVVRRRPSVVRFRPFGRAGSSPKSFFGRFSAFLTRRSCDLGAASF